MTHRCTDPTCPMHPTEHGHSTQLPPRPFMRPGGSDSIGAKLTYPEGDTVVAVTFLRSYVANLYSRDAALEAMLLNGFTADKPVGVYNNEANFYFRQPPIPENGYEGVPFGDERMWA